MHQPSEPDAVPRLVPHQPLPPYSYVPGLFPHPLTDLAGHSHGSVRTHPAAPDPDHWQGCEPYQFGIDLFNHGYYWEAHEAWEGLWHACHRTGLTATFLKGLIKLAAAGVKAREGRNEGVQSHGRRAAELFQQAGAQLGAEKLRYMGLPLAELVSFAEELAGGSPVKTAGPGKLVEVVFDFVLRPALSASKELSKPAPGP
jgi:hypothetical protein